ncbi:MAG TPA: hypothetical protein VFY61_01380 [Pyrinomonadaceae bacterium]|nr:hypothetical protein [Pyrinomonadaceae bacterium]
MRASTHKHRVGLTELTFFLIGIILLLLLAVVAKGQQPVYNQYRGVRLGMTAAEARAKLGDPVLKTDEQDYYVLSPNESTQIVYDASQKVVTISTDYVNGVGAPDYKTVLGEGALLERPDGSLFKMVQYRSAGMWVSYNKSAAIAPMVTVTIQVMK